MSARDEGQRDEIIERLLSAVPHHNEAAEVTPAGDGAMVTVPLARPKWLIPPISWIVPFSGRRRIRLDGPGKAVLDLCDGRRTVEEVIETFAQNHKLSFREGQLAVTTFLRQLVECGIIAIAGS